MYISIHNRQQVFIISALCSFVINAWALKQILIGSQCHWPLARGEDPLVTAVLLLSVIFHHREILTLLHYERPSTSKCLSSISDSLALNVFRNTTALQLNNRHLLSKIHLNVSQAVTCTHDARRTASWESGGQSQSGTSLSVFTSAIQEQQTLQNTDHTLSDAEKKERHNEGEWMGRSSGSGAAGHHVSLD